MNIAEKLKNAPKGMALYSPIFGDCTLVSVDKDGIITVNTSEDTYTFLEDGAFTNTGECMLFPSRCVDNRDWDKFVVPSSVISVGDHVLYKGSVYKVAYVHLYGDDDIMLVPDEDDEGEFSVPEDDVIKLNHWDDKYFKPFDKVLVRPNKASGWFINYFNSITDNDKSYVCLDDCYAFCIPYNWETRHLLGTTDEEPEFYKQQNQQGNEH